MFKKRGSYKPDNNLKSAFKKIKSEFEEHLDAINQNTNEIQANYEYLFELESKIDKLSERLDELSVFLGISPKGKEFNAANNTIYTLTKSEKEIFSAIYSLGEEKEYIIFKDIVKKTLMPESFVINNTSNLINKGIPIIKRFINNEVCLKLDPAFRYAQAKEDFLNINKPSQKMLVKYF